MKREIYTRRTFFTNVQAQDFIHQLRTNGVNILHAIVKEQRITTPAQMRRFLTACEVVAAANGHPAAASGWCTPIEEWLFDCQYQPDDGQMKLARKHLDRIISKAGIDTALGIPLRDLEGLLCRLNKPRRKIVWKPVKGDRRRFRELATWLDLSQGEETNGPEFDRSGSARVVLTYVTVNAACKLVEYRKVHSLELWLNDNNDPRELTAAMRILLRGWCQSLREVDFDHVVDATATGPRPAYKALCNCSSELGNLPALERFGTSDLYFNDKALSEVCRNPKLSVIHIDNAQISKNAIQILGSCSTLKSVLIRRCRELTEADRTKLAKRLPKAEFILITRR